MRRTLAKKRTGDGGGFDGVRVRLRPSSALARQVGSLTDEHVFVLRRSPFDVEGQPSYFLTVARIKSGEAGGLSVARLLESEVQTFCERLLVQVPREGRV